MELTKAGKEEFALAILLWKDLKCDGRFDLDVSDTAIKMAQHVGVEKEFKELLIKIPPMKIIER